MVSRKRCIAFDADYTVISYHYQNFISLQYRCLSSCLVSLGLPSSILGEEYTTSVDRYVSNGVIGDLKTGYLLKLDENKRILSAYHGFEKVSQSALEKLYDNLIYPLENLNVYYIKEDRYLFISHFTSGGVHAFRVCNELARKGEISLSPSEIGEKIYEAVNITYYTTEKSSEMTMFYQEFYSNPSQYLLKASNQLKRGLLRLRDENTKVLLLSNSVPEYVKFIFQYCFDGDFFNYFDLWIYSALKPHFFSQGREFVSLSNKELMNGSQAKLKEIVPADDYYYVGDHYIGDMWVSHTAGWHSCLILNELVFEKGFSGVVKSPRDVENMRENISAPYFQNWGSHFRMEGTNTFWWNFIINNSSIISGSIEGLVTNL